MLWVFGVFLSAWVLFCVTACSWLDLYHIGQEYQFEKCRTGPPSLYEECMAQAEKDYEAYKKENAG